MFLLAVSKVKIVKFDTHVMHACMSRFLVGELQRIKVTKNPIINYWAFFTLRLPPVCG